MGRKSERPGRQHDQSLVAVPIGTRRGSGAKRTEEILGDRAESDQVLVRCSTTNDMAAIVALVVFDRCLAMLQRWATLTARAYARQHVGLYVVGRAS